MRKLMAIIGVLALFVSFVPVTVSAQDVTCRCWCASGDGAKDGGTTSASECPNECSKLGADFLTCAQAGDRSTPIANSLCWLPDDCIAPNDDGEVTGEVRANEQPKECLPGYRYCYAVTPPSSFPQLAIPFGPIREVRDIGSYIAVVYNWAVGAGAVFALIIFIVGAIMYMLSAGSGQTQKARDLMKNSVMGFALLLVSYLLLQTVNPATLNLELPGLRKPKPVFITQSRWCEELAELEYANSSGTIDPIGECGAPLEVTRDPAGVPLEDTTCVYRSCPDPDEACRVNERTGTGVCRSCIDNTENIQDSSEPILSNGFCKQMSTSDGEFKSECRFMTATASNIANSACVKIDLDCGVVDSCDDYNSAVVTHKTRNENQQSGIVSTSAETATALELSQQRIGEEPLRSFCTDDPCQIGPCRMVTGSTTESSFFGLSSTTVETHRCADSPR